MALTASDLITAAKKRSYGSRGKQKISDAMLLEELNYQDTLVVQMASQIAPDLLATVSGTVTLTDSGNQGGYTLQQGIHYRDFTHVDEADDEYTPITIIRRADRDRSPPAPAAILRAPSAAAIFYPVDPEGERWSTASGRNWYDPDSGHKVSYSYVPKPGGLTSLSGTLRSPDIAREVLVASLELQILLSQWGQIPPVQQEIHQQKVQAALAKRQGAWDSLRMQMYKFIHPQGSEGNRKIADSDTMWVQNQVAG